MYFLPQKGFWSLSSFGLLNGIGVNNLVILNFGVKCKLKVYFNSHKERGQGCSSMKLKQNNGLEFKAKLVYTNQKRWW